MDGRRYYKENFFLKVFFVLGGRIAQKPVFHKTKIAYMK